MVSFLRIHPCPVLQDSLLEEVDCQKNRGHRGKGVGSPEAGGGWQTRWSARICGRSIKKSMKNSFGGRARAGDGASTRQQDA